MLFNFWKAQSHGIAKGLQSIKTVMMGVMWVTMATNHPQREQNAREYNSKYCLGMSWIENTALLLCPSKFSSYRMATKNVSSSDWCVFLPLSHVLRQVPDSPTTLYKLLKVVPRKTAPRATPSSFSSRTRNSTPRTQRYVVHAVLATVIFV